MDPILQDCNAKYDFQHGHVTVKGTCYEKATLLQHVHTQIQKAHEERSPVALVDPYRNSLTVPTIASLYPLEQAYPNVEWRHLNNPLIIDWAKRGRQTYPLSKYTTLIRGRTENSQYTTMAFPCTVKWREIDFQRKSVIVRRAKEHIHAVMIHENDSKRVLENSLMLYARNLERAGVI